MPFDAQAVFFDAGATLLLPTTSIPAVYLREACAVTSSAPEREAFMARFAACWAELREAAFCEENALATDEQRERAMWHEFTSLVAAPFPDLAAVHEEWLARLVAWFDSAEAWEPAPRTHALLRALRDDGRCLGVVSNWHDALHGILEAHELSKLFDFVLVSSEHGYRKPHRSIFEAALKAAGARADQAVHIGDALRDDVEGARDAGIRPILIAPSRPEALPGEVRQVPDLSALLG